MKKKVILFAMLAFGGTAIAQQGSWYVGGQVGFSSQTSKFYSGNTIFEGKTTMYNVSPEVGTFLADDLSVGFALNFSGQKDDNDVADTDYDKQSLTSPVLYARKFWSIEEILSVFVGLDVNFSTGNNKENRNDVLNTVSKVSGFGANLNVGVALPLGEKFTAVGKYGLLGYSSTTNKDDAGVKQNSSSEFAFNVNTLGPVFNVGLYYTFKQ